MKTAETKASAGGLAETKASAGGLAETKALTNDFMELTEKLCLICGPSGIEDEVRAAIEAEIKPHCEKLYTDKSGNLIAYKRGRKRADKLLLFAAHMDEVGFMVEHISEEGYLSFGTVGGIDPSVIGGRRMLIGDKKLLGVVASKAIHMQKKDERGVCPPVSEMYVDIGCTSREDALKYVSIGDCGVFVPNFERFGDGCIKSKALDDRLGCAVLCELIKGELEYDAVFAFTVCEEVGCRGAATVAYALRPDICVIVEGTTAGDLPDAPEANRACAVGQGGVLSVMDRGTIYDRKLFDKAVSLAKKAGVKYQVKNTVAGGNDSQSFQRAAEGSRVLALSAPVRYIHSATSVVRESDLADVLSLARVLADGII